MMVREMGEENRRNGIDSKLITVEPQARITKHS